MPLVISLVMPALNAAPFIGDALDSLAAQNMKGTFELVLADGGSTDDTRKIAQNYAFVRILNGGDNSLYEGLNRGLAATKGELIGFLNADDLLQKGALSLILDAFDHDSNPDYVSGGVSQQVFSNNPPQ